MEINEYAGKITAKHARLIYKITNELEKRDKALAENGHDLQSAFRQGFLLAQEIVDKAIESLPEVEKPTEQMFITDKEIEEAYTDPEDVMYSDFSRWCDGAKWMREKMLKVLFKLKEG